MRRVNSPAFAFFRPWRVDSFDRLALALFLSAGLHLFVIFGLHFTLPDLKKAKSTGMPLDVVLVNAKSASRPQHADVLAQANLDGGGNTEEERRAKSPLPVMQRDRPESDAEEVNARVQQLETQAQQLMTRIKSEHDIVQNRATPASQPQERKESPDSVDLAQRSLQMARLEAQISRDWDAYQKKPRRMFIGARAREYSLARYEEDWRQKIERVGNLNYPEMAKQQKLYGALQLTVHIRADGSLENVEINRSSGHKVLDAAAVRIVELAAPFSALPEDVRKKVDILGITRTWMFTRADQLTTQSND